MKLRHWKFEDYILPVGILIFAVCFSVILFHYYNVSLKNRKLTFSALCILIFPLFKKFIEAHKKIIENDNSLMKITHWDIVQLFIEIFWLAGFIAGSAAIIIRRVISAASKYINVGDLLSAFSVILGLGLVMLIMHFDDKAYKD